MNPFGKEPDALMLLLGLAVVGIGWSVYERWTRPEGVVEVYDTPDPDWIESAGGL